MNISVQDPMLSNTLTLSHSMRSYFSSPADKMPPSFDVGESPEYNKIMMRAEFRITLQPTSWIKTISKSLKMKHFWPRCTIFRGRLFTGLSFLYVWGHHSYYYEQCIMRRLLIGSKLKAFSSLINHCHCSFMFAYPFLFDCQGENVYFKGTPISTTRAGIQPEIIDNGLIGFLINNTFFSTLTLP